MKGHDVVLAMDHRDQPGVVGVPVHLFTDGRTVAVLGKPAGDSAQQGLGERQQSRHCRKRVAGQPHQAGTAVGEARQKHGMARAYGHPIDEKIGADLGQHRVDMVHRAGGCPTRGEDQVGIGGDECPTERPGIVPEPPGLGHLGPQSTDPGGKHGSERIPDQSVVRKPRREEFITEHEDIDTGPGYGDERVVPSGSRQPEHGWSHHGPQGQKLIA